MVDTVMVLVELPSNVPQNVPIQVVTHTAGRLVHGCSPALLIASLK